MSQNLQSIRILITLKEVSHDLAKQLFPYIHSCFHIHAMNVRSK